MTHRIYYTEPWRREFDATVSLIEIRDGRTIAYLDRTAFYPTSGGQPHDTGTLGEVRVVAVEDDERGVAHVIEGPVGAGQQVHGAIDWTRRFDHMQQHTGQHLLSAAFDHLFSARTESFHLGSESSTIDLGPEVNAAQIAEAELEACRVVWNDVPVSIRFVSEEEASRLPLRKEPARGGQLRLIEVEGFDLSACGGTHVSRTGEIGIIAVRGWERFRGGTRVEFACGGRALASFQALRGVVAGSIRHLSVHPTELPDAIARLQADLKDLRKVTRDQATRLAAYQAVEMAAGAQTAGRLRVVVAAPEGYDATGIKWLASAIVKQPAIVAVLFTRTAPLQVVAARSPDLMQPDCAELLRMLFDRFGGRGGGKPDLAQGGGLDAGLQEILDAARRSIAASS